MKIDLESLSYDELVNLNQKIVARLKFLDAMHTHREMLQFAPGDQVSFEPPGRGKQSARIFHAPDVFIGKASRVQP